MEDLMPVIFGCGSRNGEVQRIEAHNNIVRRHQDLRYRGVGHWDSVRRVVAEGCFKMAAVGGKQTYYRPAKG